MASAADSAALTPHVRFAAVCAAPLSISFIGNARTSFVGLGVATSAALLIGAPPIAFPALPLTNAMPYLIVALLCLGFGVALVPNGVVARSNWPTSRLLLLPLGCCCYPSAAAATSQHSA